MSDPKFKIESASIVVRMADGSMRSMELQDDERERLTADISVSTNEVDISQFTRSADRVVFATGAAATIHLRGSIASHLDKQGTPAPWRFDVPEVPPSVTALKDSDGDIWLRLARNKWSAVSWPGDSRSFADLIDYAPLVECEDPRSTS